MRYKPEKLTVKMVCSSCAMLLINRSGREEDLLPAHGKVFSVRFIVDALHLSVNPSKAERFFQCFSRFYGFGPAGFSE